MQKINTLRTKLASFLHTIDRFSEKLVGIGNSIKGYYSKEFSSRIEALNTKLKEFDEGYKRIKQGNSKLEEIYNELKEKTKDEERDFNKYIIASRELSNEIHRWMTKYSDSIKDITIEKVIILHQGGIDKDKDKDKNKDKNKDKDKDKDKEVGDEQKKLTKKTRKGSKQDVNASEALKGKNLILKILQKKDRQPFGIECSFMDDYDSMTETNMNRREIHCDASLNFLWACVLGLKSSMHNF
jgi:hypothetical protein